jgi:hypothetical protein
MKRNRVRQATTTETPGIIARTMKVINENPNTSAGYAAWTLGTAAAVTLALRGQSKGERHSRTISQGAISALGSHLTSTGFVVMDASSDNLAQNVANIINNFFCKSFCPNVSIKAISNQLGNFTISLVIPNPDFLSNTTQSKSFTLTQDEMNSIITANTNQNVQGILDVVKNVFKTFNITLGYRDGEITNEECLATYNPSCTSKSTTPDCCNYSL